MSKRQLFFQKKCQKDIFHDSPLVLIFLGNPIIFVTFCSFLLVAGELCDAWEKPKGTVVSHLTKRGITFSRFFA